MTESKSKKESKGEGRKEPKADEWKVCSRGHKYKGTSGCPICWRRHGGGKFGSANSMAHKG